MSRTEHIAGVVEYEPIITELIASAGRGPLILLLSGDLGSGKTTFVQSLGQTLRVSELITSPTFTIMQQYETKHPDFDSLVHIDAYRFESGAEAGILDLPKLFSAPRSVVCVEWPERLGSLVEDYPHWELHFQLQEDDSRRLTMARTNEQ